MITQTTEILSYDGGKIKSYVNLDNHAIYAKSTTMFEFQNLVRANIYLQNNPIYLINNIRILTVCPIDYNTETKILETYYFEGENLELLLRNKSTDRKFILHLIKDFFKKTYESGFFWGDCAPRNMLLSLSRGEIRILDFERNLIIDSKLSNDEKFIIRHFRNYSYEEFFSFLFSLEQKSLRKYIENEPLYLVPITSINSKRKKLFLLEFFGNNSSYTTKEIAFVEDLIVNASSPFSYKKSKVFPIIYADRIYEKIGFCAYNKFINEFQKITKKEKYEKIERYKKFF